MQHCPYPSPLLVPQSVVVYNRSLVHRYLYNILTTQSTAPFAQYHRLSPASSDSLFLGGSLLDPWAGYSPRPSGIFTIDHPYVAVIVIMIIFLQHTTHEAKLA